ncbi:MAG: helix-turn-helix domain-containing protein [Oscillospiraceae bacterium]|nr:helix-turn-helix domain-containing protein [Oscillospiraceae bacterium]
MEVLFMNNNKTEIMMQIVTLLSQLIEEDKPVESVKSEKAESSDAPIEMLTIKECTEVVKGISEHTVRQLVAQEKIAFVRTGQGDRGKILVSKRSLLEYLGA